MIHIFKFIGEGGAVLELRLDDGKHETVEESFREIEEEQQRTALRDPPNQHLKESIEENMEYWRERELASKKMISEIREEEIQKERDRIQKEGIGKLSIVIQKDKS